MNKLNDTILIPKNVSGAGQIEQQVKQFKKALIKNANEANKGKRHKGGKKRPSNSQGPSLRMRDNKFNGDTLGRLDPTTKKVSKHVTYSTREANANNSERVAIIESSERVFANTNLTLATTVFNALKGKMRIKFFVEYIPYAGGVLIANAAVHLRKLDEIEETGCVKIRGGTRKWVQTFQLKGNEMDTMRLCVSPIDTEPALDVKMSDKVGDLGTFVVTTTIICKADSVNFDNLRTSILQSRTDIKSTA
jgi:hypothetical protein